uniref:Integrase catalytic domain-containing protein n=1 Tax=Strongyloides stercoralis TaxID=6248 RepID=A0A0K0E598_STRER
MNKYDTEIGSIRTDSVKELKSKDYTEFLFRYGIEVEYGLRYEHSTTGAVERSIRTIRNIILKSNLNILTDCKKIMSIYNNMTHDTTDIKPRDLIFNFSKEAKAPQNIHNMRIQLELLERLRHGKKKVFIRDARKNKVQLKKIIIDDIAKTKNPCFIVNSSNDGRKKECISAYKFREI